MNSIAYFIRQGSQSLAEHLRLERSDAISEAKMLMRHMLAIDAASLILHEKDSLDVNQQMDFDVLVKRRLNGEPIAYIIGSREFYGLVLKTSPATLIPRPDTETLVEVALAKIPINSNLEILDLGTGTGAMALAIAKNRPYCKVTGIDASDGALNIALVNIQVLKLMNVCLHESNWFSALDGEKFDVIVSNPPYIAEGDCHLIQGDLRFEPRLALVSGVDGLDDIRRIVRDAPNYLKPNGWLMLEHGYDQARSVAALLKSHGFSQIDHAQDLAGTLRVTFGSIA